MKKPFFAGIAGNIFEHYDLALFGLLAPFLAPLFFHKQDPVTALLFTYMIIPLGIIGKPLGALFFGLMGDRLGRKRALCASLFGAALTSIAIGCLPTSKELGIAAPISLAILRLLQSFFSAAETPLGAIYVLENSPSAQRAFTSSLFDSSTIVGIMIASLLVTLFPEMWRLLFWIGGLTALMGLWIRMQKEEERIAQDSPAKISEYKESFFAIVLAAGFSYVSYSLPFVLMNGYIPLVTSLQKEEVMQLNTWLLAVDLLLLPLFGYLAKKIGEVKVMLFGSIASLLCVVPLLLTLGPSTTLFEVAIIRFLLVFFGVAFAAPYHAWALTLVPPHRRGTLLSLGYTLGAQVIGTPTAAISLFLYQKTGWSFAPALYFMPVALGATFALMRHRLRSEIRRYH